MFERFMYQTLVSQKDFRQKLLCGIQFFRFQMKQKPYPSVLPPDQLKQWVKYSHNKENNNHTITDENQPPMYAWSNVYA